MTKNLFLILLCFLLGSLSGFATAFGDANQQFKSGDFAGAAAAYEKILTSEGPRASVYYNLGNSYQQLKQYGPAILAYERARVLTPRDPNLIANLAMARKAANTFEEAGRYPWLDSVVNRLSRNEWSWLVAGSAFFLGLLAVAFGVVRLPRRGVIISASVAALFIATASTALYLRRAEASLGIILSEDATIRISPFEKAEPLGISSPGSTVQLGMKNGDFQYIEVQKSNLKGWLASKDVAVIAQSARFEGLK